MGKRKRLKRFPKKYCTIDFYECIGYNKKGQGIVIYKNKPFFVDRLILKEKARLLVWYEYPENGEARAIQILQKSKDRQLALDHPKMELGTYHIAHLTNEAQDRFKMNRVKEVFPKNNISSIIVGERTFYRNKVSLTDGGFKPPGKRRKQIIIPSPKQFDLMKLDFNKYANSKGPLIIRRLDNEIVGKPGAELFTTYTIFDKQFRINLNSFFQINNEMAKIAYQDILDNIDDNTIVWDLFAGAAIIGVLVSSKAKKVYSVEISKDSHRDGLYNIHKNHLNNIEAILGDANYWAINNSHLKPDVIILDPARSGLSIESCEIINKANAKKIIYLSCNIDTQVRDIKLFTNYKIIKIQPYDFFPQTFHIENLVVLEKK